MDSKPTPRYIPFPFRNLIASTVFTGVVGYSALGTPGRYFIPVAEGTTMRTVLGYALVFAMSVHCIQSVLVYKWGKELKISTKDMVNGVLITLALGFPIPLELWKAVQSKRREETKAE